MYFKHFLKRVISFVLIIGLGILALFAINMYQKNTGGSVDASGAVTIPQNR